MTSSILMRWTGLINCAGSHPHVVMTSNQLEWNCNPCYCQGARSRPRQCVGAWRSANLGESVWQDIVVVHTGHGRWISFNNQAPIWPIWQLHGTVQYSNLTKVVSQPDSIFGLSGRSRGKYSSKVESVTIFSKLTLRLDHAEFSHHLSNWGCGW